MNLIPTFAAQYLRNATESIKAPIDLKNRPIHLRSGKTKNNEGRVVKMTPEVYDLIRVCVEGNRTTPSYAGQRQPIHGNLR